MSIDKRNDNRKAQQPAKPNEEKKQGRWERFYSKHNKDQPSAFLQKTSIWITLAFTLITGVLAVLSAINTSEIKGMKEMLQTFSPKLKYKVTQMAISNDTLKGLAVTKNFGTRPATGIKLDHYILWQQGNPVQNFVAKFENYLASEDIYPQEDFPTEFYFSLRGIPLSIQHKFSIAFKVTFTDTLTKDRDSSYTCVVSTTTDLSNPSATFASFEQKKTILDNIRMEHPEF